MRNGCDPVDLEAVVVGGLPAASERLVAMGRLLTMMPAVVVNDLGARRASHGSALRPEDLAAAGRDGAGGGSQTTSSDRRLRLLDQAGALLGLVERRDDGLLHPLVVLV